jgi:hypothetical protein
MGLLRGEANVDDDRLRRPLLLSFKFCPGSSDRSIILAQLNCVGHSLIATKVTNAIPLPAVVSLAAAMCHRIHNK